MKKRMKKLSLLLAVVMIFSCLIQTASAEEAAVQESASGFFYIEADGEQPRLSASSADRFFQADGLWFKDMNGNGQLDPYEDWRLSDDERTADLLTRMTLEMKAGTLGFGGVGGNNGIKVTQFDSGSGEPTGMNTNKFIAPDSEQMTNDTDEVLVVDGATYAPMAYQIQTMYETTMIGAMTGTPKEQLDVFNKLQALAEDTELGIPMVFSGDRVYNTWGGMIDAPHYSFGIAHDEELLYDLMSEYARESAAIGYHQVFHGYGNEIGSFYGEDPNYIAKMVAIETRAYNDNGFQAHSKHFIARGGRSMYVDARSPADLIDSWLVGWKAVVDAGTEYIMTNNNVGRTPGLQGYLDKDTYTLLRDQLGYDGVICLDWPLSAASILGLTGVTNDGIDVSTLTLGERYTLMLDVGIDMFSCYSEAKGVELSDTDTAITNCYHPDAVVEEIKAGKYTEEALDKHVARILKNKFGLGIFENPYRDWEEALQVIGEAAAASVDSVPMSNEEIDALRRPELIALEERLMVESTVVFKNDGVLPLSGDASVYVESNAGTKERIEAAIAEKAAVVDALEDATVAVFHVSSFNDAYEQMIDDAWDAGVPIVVIFEGSNTTDPSLREFIDADALLMQTFSNQPDHGSSIGSFYRYTTPSVTADMLFGDREPSGKSLFEIGYEDDAGNLDWGELQDDVGVSDEVRLYMAMLAKRDPTFEMPNNLGDVVTTEGFGIEYSKPADIQLSLLTLPKSVQEAEVESNGSTSMQSSVGNISPLAGEPFQLSFVAENVGEGDGLITVPVLANGEKVAEKVVGVTAGQFRVITMTITLEAGDYTLSVGDLTDTVTVLE